MTAPDPRVGDLIERYRQAMTDIGFRDDVAMTDERAEHLWQQARLSAAADLSPQQFAALPARTVTDHGVPADVSSSHILDHIERWISGEPDPDHSGHGSLQARPILLGWAAACLVLAIVLGATGVGASVVPAFIPPLVTAGLLLRFGPGPLPGVVWSIGLWPLAIILHGSGGLHLLTGVIFIALVEVFAYAIRVLGRDQQDQREASGGPYDTRQQARIQRRPLELTLVTYTLAVATQHSDYGPLVALICVGGLLFRRRVGTIGVLAVCAGATLLAQYDASRTSTVNGAFPIVFAALTAHWVQAFLTSAWYERLKLTEWALILTGRGIRAGYRRGTSMFPTSLGEGPLSRHVTAAPPPKPTNDLPDGQFMRYCASHGERRVHMHVGLSQPKCIDCAKRNTGASYHDPTFQRYCSHCNSTFPHTRRGCTNCGK